MKKIISFLGTTVFILLTFLVMPAQATQFVEMDVIADCEKFNASGLFYTCFPWHDGDYIHYEVELLLINSEGELVTTYSGHSDPISDPLNGETDPYCVTVPFDFTEDWGPLPSGNYTVEGKLTVTHHGLIGWEDDSLPFGPIIFECGNDVVEGCTLGFWKNNGGVVQKNGKTDDDCWCADYSSGDTLSPIFDFPDSLSTYRTDTLIEALNYGGGDDLGIQNMLRQAVASLLNACSGKVDFYNNDPQVIIDMVNDALANPEKISDAMDDFEKWNESETDDVCMDGRCEDSMEECNDDGLVCDPVHNCPIDSKCNLKIPAEPAFSAAYDFFITSPALQEAMTICGDGCGQEPCVYN